MGCLAVERKKKEEKEKMPPYDYKLIWTRCLLLDQIHPHTPPRYDHPAFLQIAKDIDRTFPTHPYFEQPHSKKTFESVLKGFALQFPRVGYTQGLNFVTGFLLIAGLDQKEALKAIIGLCSNNDLMLLGLYEDEFPLCRLYCELFWQVAEITSPEAARLLKSANLPDELWLFQWFITLFIYSLPLSYIRDIFNFIIVKRYFAAIRIAVAILQSLEKYMANVSSMKEDGFIECFELMKNEDFCRKYLPLEGILRRAQKIKKELITQCLQETKCHNWYKYYFLTVSPHREKKYQRFINDLAAERERFQNQNCDKKSNRYSRDSSSMQILDNIEQTRMKRYSRVLSRSSWDRQNIFCSNLTIKRYNSLELIGLPDN